jgi:glutamate-1-semialdehyde 2,1-aminomutase
MIEGSFHGHFDSAMLEINPDEDIDGGLEPLGVGVPKILRGLVNIVPLNDANRIEDVLKKRGDQIGTFLIEPILGNAGSITADEQYLKDARELCDRYELVMLIDEVKTGFRVARGGVQELMGVRADLCTFAKALGNGYPISALAGREDIMRHIGGDNGIAQGGTYAAHPVCVAAVNKTLEILDETDTLEQIANYGERLQQGISGILSGRGIAHVFTGHPSMGGLFFTETSPRNYREWATTNYEFYNALALELNDLGILCEPDSREPWFICAAHDDACLAETLEKFETALTTIIEERSMSPAKA